MLRIVSFNITFSLKCHPLFDQLPNVQQGAASLSSLSRLAARWGGVAKRRMTFQTTAASLNWPLSGDLTSGGIACSRYRLLLQEDIKPQLDSFSQFRTLEDGGNLVNLCMGFYCLLFGYFICWLPIFILFLFDGFSLWGTRIRKVSERLFLRWFSEFDPHM